MQSLTDMSPEPLKHPLSKTWFVWCAVALVFAAGCDDTQYSASSVVIPDEGGDAINNDEEPVEPPRDDVVEPPPDFMEEPPECVFKSDTTLARVTIAFDESQTCVFTLEEAAAGLNFNYEVVVSDVVGGLTTLPQDAGGCAFPDETGMILFEEVGGEDQQYCLCDQGLCGFNPQPVDLKPGTYEKVFEWNGVNWSGPSDTGNPLGEPFPPGTYTVRVSTVGVLGAGEDFEASGTMTVTLTP